MLTQNILSTIVHIAYIYKSNAFQMYTYDEQSFTVVGLEEESTLDLKLGEIFRIRSNALIKNIMVYKKVNYQSMLQLFGDHNH